MKALFLSRIILLAVAVVGCAALIAMSVTVAAYGAKSQQVEIRILSPRDGETISLSPSERVPAERPIKGDVLGFTKKEIKDLQLRVEVSIQTTQLYPQGIAAVRSDGSWELRKGYFGGSVHTIRAVLKDGNGNERAIATATVTIIQ